MILRTLTILFVIAIIAAIAIPLMVLSATVLHHAIEWIASDERIAWGVVAAMGIVGLAIVMEGHNHAN